jgi:phage-related protein
MPGSVANAAPTTVLPWKLCQAFSRTSDWMLTLNTYRGGETQRTPLTTTSRLSWQITFGVNATDLAALLAFYQARKGSHQAFYFYDPLEYSTLFSYDPTGVSAVGRYTVRFEGSWESTTNMPRSTVGIRLVQIA